MMRRFIPAQEIPEIANYLSRYGTYLGKETPYLPSGGLLITGRSIQVAELRTGLRLTGAK